MSGNTTVTYQPAPKKDEDMVEEGQAEDTTPNISKFIYGKNEPCIARQYLRGQLQSSNAEIHPLVHFLNMAELMINYIKSQVRDAVK